MGAGRYAVVDDAGDVLRFATLPGAVAAAFGKGRCQVRDLETGDDVPVPDFPGECRED